MVMGNWGKWIINVQGEKWKKRREKEKKLCTLEEQWIAKVWEMIAQYIPLYVKWPPSLPSTWCAAVRSQCPPCAGQPGRSWGGAAPCPAQRSWSRLSERKTCVDVVVVYNLTITAIGYGHGTWDVQGILADGYRLRSTHCREFPY